MQEMTDGSFGEIRKSQELLEKLMKDRFELRRTKAIHFGTEEELKDIKKGKDGWNLDKDDQNDSLEELDKRIGKLEELQARLIARQTSPVIQLSPIEVEAFCKEHKRDFLKKKHKTDSFRK